MDAATNRQLRNLDRRLQAIFNAAYQQAIENEKNAIAKFAAFAQADHSDLTETQLRTAWNNYRLQVERTTGIVNNIAADMANSGKLAARMIEGDKLNVFDIGYRNSLTSIDRQLGFNVQWSIYDKNQLTALLMEQDKSPFTQIAYNRLGKQAPIVTHLQNELAQAVMLGEGIPGINRRIRNVADMSYKQAQRIARTETLRVANQGRMIGFRQAANEYGIEMFKQWISTMDERTRDTHVDMHMEKAELDEPFSNGLMEPLDPDGSPEETINCRCVVVAILKDIKEKQVYRV